MLRLVRGCDILRHTTLGRTAWQCSLETKRHSSDKNDGRDRLGDCVPCEKPPCQPPPPHLPQRAPTHPDDPCNQNLKASPRDYDCHTDNLMDKLPPRQFPFDEHNRRRKKRYAAYLAVGTIAFLASFYVAFRVITDPPPREKIVRKFKRPKIKVKVPAKIEEIPNKVKYLLVGGGTAAFAAFRAIKSNDPTAQILIISAENDNPYMRPPLSKEMWFNSDKSAVKKLTFKQWNGSERSLFYEPKDFYVKVKELERKENGGVSVAQGYTVERIDVMGRKVTIEGNYNIEYDKCLLATGALPKNLDIFRNAEPKIQDCVTLFRDIFDFQELYNIVENANTIAVIGGGFLGSELACAMARARKDLRVMQIFRESGNMGKILPEYLSLWTSEKVKKEGVELVPQTEVTGVQYKNEKMLLTLSNDDTVEVDHVIVAVGVEPNTELAEKSNLEVDPDMGGFLVNTELQARSNLYAAGDCACFYDTKLGRRRVEHHDHAVVSGRLAGENMTGAGKPYWHQSMFWSDLGPDVGYEAIGIVDSRLPTVGVFAKATEADSPKAIVTATNEGDRSKTEEAVSPECKTQVRKDPEMKALAEEINRKGKETDDFGKGIIFYLRDDIVVGIVMWNVFNRMNIARQVLKEDRKYDDLNEVAKLFNIHGEPESIDAE